MSLASQRTKPLCTALLAVATIGCYGAAEIGVDRGIDPAPQWTDPTDPTAPAVQCGQPPPTRIWRLSHEQYDHTVRDLLGTTLTPAQTFETETSGSGFKNASDTSYVSATLAEEYQ